MSLKHRTPKKTLSSYFLHFLLYQEITWKIRNYIYSRSDLHVETIPAMRSACVNRCVAFISLYKVTKEAAGVSTSYLLIKM